MSCLVRASSCPTLATAPRPGGNTRQSPVRMAHSYSRPICTTQTCSVSKSKRRGTNRFVCRSAVLIAFSVLALLSRSCLNPKGAFDDCTHSSTAWASARLHSVHSLPAQGSGKNPAVRSVLTLMSLEAPGSDDFLVILLLAASVLTACGPTATMGCPG